MSTENSSIHTRKYRQILSAVHMVYRLVNSTYNVKELTLRLTRLVCQFIKGNTCTIYIVDEKTNRLKSKAIFDNRINMFVVNKSELSKLSRIEKKLLGGFAISQKHALGLPLVSDENIGAILIQRKNNEPAFTDFDRDMLAVMAEQSVTAIKNIQLSEEQQNVILGSIRLVGKLLENQSPQVRDRQSPVYFKVVQSLGEKLRMGKEGMDRLYYASILRDAGAIDIPFDILSKSSHLTPDEFKVIREQPARAVELIKPVEFLQPVLPIILYHHEKYDGTGYPSGLSRDQIPLGARILHAVDAFEAMTRERPYKRKLTDDEALKELEHNSGTQFDPQVVSAFLSLSKQKKFRKYLRSLHK